MLPENRAGSAGQTEYTFIASAVRSRNIDEAIRAFLSRSPEGAVVNVGCGLETPYHRNDNGKARWFELDLPEVLTLRNKHFPEEERDRYLPYSMSDPVWMDPMGTAADAPVLVCAAGLFHCFAEEQVLAFIRSLARFRDVRIIFDAVSSMGLRHTRQYMKRLGKQDAAMFFSVDDPQSFAVKVSPETFLLEDMPFFSRVRPAYGTGIPTRMAMFFSDALNMVKMIYLRIS